ncbi:MAG: hypothetical protein AAGH65_06310 [Pseudomonadota bacterium]
MDTLFDTVALVRAAPQSRAVDRLQRWLQSSVAPHALVFLQGDAVELATVPERWAPPRSGWRYLVCEGSWRRRIETSPMAPFEIGSLIALYAALRSPSSQLIGFGADE